MVKRIIFFVMGLPFVFIGLGVVIFVGMIHFTMWYLKRIGERMRMKRVSQSKDDVKGQLSKEI